MSYTNQKVIWEPCAREGNEQELYLVDVDGKELVDSNLKKLIVENSVDIYGDSIMDEYNDIEKIGTIDIKARKQPHEDVLKTLDGKEVLTKSYFYVDPRIEPNALKIAYMDKLDGEIVMQKYVMCDLYNKPKMVRFITI